MLPAERTGTAYGKPLPERFIAATPTPTPSSTHPMNQTQKETENDNYKKYRTFTPQSLYVFSSNRKL